MAFVTIEDRTAKTIGGLFGVNSDVVIAKVDNLEDCVSLDEIIENGGFTNNELTAIGALFGTQLSVLGLLTLKAIDFNESDGLAGTVDTLIKHIDKFDVTDGRKAVLLGSVLDIISS